jgi:hypothetical protein
MAATAKGFIAPPNSTPLCAKGLRRMNEFKVQNPLAAADDAE